MNRHSSRALSIRLLSTGTSLDTRLASSSSVFAQLVLYDGALGDADPVTQGWYLALNADRQQK
jgi:hypothetical protein